MSTDLVPVDNVTALDTLDPASREVSVTRMLGEARSWLAHAVEATQPQHVANFKAFVATVAESTKHLGMSKEIQLDAQEMVRRAEYALGKAIRKGQGEGTVYAPGKNPASRHDYLRNGRPVRGAVDQEDSSSVPVTDIASRSDLYNTKGNIMDLAEAPADTFEVALGEAKAEGNLSRANVVRKVKRSTTAPPEPVDTTTGKIDPPQSRAAVQHRRAQIRALAADGYSSRQIGERVGIGDVTVRRIARTEGIDIPADKVMAGIHRIDSNRVVEQTVLAADIGETTLNLIDYAALDREQIEGWVSSLKDSIRSLTTLRNNLMKELNQP